MATKTIPAQHLVTCDRCGADVTGKRGLNVAGSIRWSVPENSTLVFASHASIDLCETCTAALEAWMLPGKLQLRETR